MDSHTTTNNDCLLIANSNSLFEDTSNGDALKLIELLYSLNLEQHVYESTNVKDHMLDFVITRVTDPKVES